MPSVKITIEDDSLSDQEIANKVNILGELIIEKIRENIRAMNLIVSGELLQRWHASFDGEILTIESGTKYGQFLEYGTYEYWSNYGFEDYPEIPDPKKKNIDVQLRSLYPKGVQPFAFVRKVLYNEKIMNDLVSQAFS